MSFRHACPGIAGALFLLTAMAAPADPFRDHDGQLPPPSQYSGPSFRLSHAYPSGLPAPRMPWRTAIGNVPISTGNAAAYTQALKDSIARDMVALLANDGDWDAGSRGWYHDPWLGSQREAIHGMLVGLEQVDNALFPKSGLAKPFTTYVVTYYNRIGAQTLGRIWRDPQAPQLGGGATQYADGSVTVKLAFTTAGPQAWPAMRGALSWPIMMAANATTGHFGRPTLAPAYLMQADIVVKDSQSAPQTGWVFTTLVYDRDTRPGSRGVWDQMVPLGAQWGNDPQVDSAANAGAALLETWVNPQAPLYALETLGWGGRLSGPNDHGVNDISVAAEGKRTLTRRAGNSSCLSCHGASQWNAAHPGKGMASFMMPLVGPGRGPAQGRRALSRFACARLGGLAALVPEPARHRADGPRQHPGRLRPGADLPRAAGLARGQERQGACAAEAGRGRDGGAAGVMLEMAKKRRPAGRLPLCAKRISAI
ncbi:hypothetical protein G4G28_05575 [Massilia sp. Dwa41.01b]|uniref:hypothetical protein n=1 Tax=Massilia sp. Dwa41.01b TaxID=2709302 RepID=UPI00160185EF|nr:hypothetical protein [Massilia sp. Dwa41.01b]QNA88090.1 hypothetical protein G4G28_05575 [Massilia sp. Dwa41.01b]